MLCCAAYGRTVPRAIMRINLTGGPVPILWVCDGRTVPIKWHWLPLPLGHALWGTRQFWGPIGASPSWHAVPAHDEGQGARLPSPAVLLRTPACHHTCLPLTILVAHCSTSTALRMQSQ